MAATEHVDPTVPELVLLRSLETTARGLSSREAARRLAAYGPNELTRHTRREWPRQLLAQFTHPLALLLAAAAVLAAATGVNVLAVAIVGVIVLNAILAFWQEQQAEHAIEALREYLPPHATVIRDGAETQVDARDLVPGDLILLDEGERVSADARLLEGDVEVDISTLTGESVSVGRSAALRDTGLPLLETRDLVFSGTAVTEGQARAVVFATGMQTELGRVAAMTQRIRPEESPLQQQVRRVAWLIAVIAVVVGVAFVPLGTAVAGLSLGSAVVFAIGLLVANVPEGLLPTITLALAVGVRQLARRRALVKRLTAVETLGSTDVICTDKTGTLTANRMRAERHWTEAADPRALARVFALCNNAKLEPRTGDPTEIALLELARELDPAPPDATRVAAFAFDSQRKLMSTVDRVGPDTWLHVKGAPDVLLERCTTWLEGEVERPLDAETRRRLEATFAEYAATGLRVLGAARRRHDGATGSHPDHIERELCFIGVAGLLDPPRPEVKDAVRRCHEAGITIHVVTGDHPLTARAIAAQVGIGGHDAPTVTGRELDALSEQELDELLRSGREVIFARAAPEAKLRIADALRAEGHVVAMTGDGVNDAPALRRADIGVAMGLSGTDVAREAATMILTDDNFATIVDAVEEGRRVFANIRKFVLYIFAHAPAEVVPFLVFALSGGGIPLPLTAVQILAIDLGTETLPALALGREAAEPGIMREAPRARHEGVVTRALLMRAWAFLGLVSSVLVMAGFLFVLLRAGWRPGDATGHGTALHDAYLRATAMTFAGIVACQVGTAMASRTEHASLRQVGPLSNRFLLWGIGFELVFAAAVIYLPPLQTAFGTRGLAVTDLLFLVPFPLVVWGADEWRRARLRRAGAAPRPTADPTAS